MTDVSSMSIRQAVAIALACAGVLLLAAGAEARSRGTLVVATGATGAPYAFASADGQVRGVDADLARAIGNVLGYRINVVRASPGAIAPGLTSGRYDLGMSVADTAAQEKVVDVVRYRSAGTAVPRAYGIAAPKGSELAGEVLGALRTLIADGTYRSLLAGWRVPSRAIAAPRLDAASQ